MITPTQCRAARALLDLSQRDLAERAGVSKPTIMGFERGQRQPYERTLRDIRAVLEADGVEFIPEDETGGPGVRHRK